MVRCGVSAFATPPVFTSMQVISRFRGIVITMLYRNHEPAHFHSRFAEFEMTVDILSGRVRGDFPRSAQIDVLRWLELQRSQLMANWERARSSAPLEPVPPLQ
jgi:Domain of unknown function (DUF4160)